MNVIEIAKRVLDRGVIVNAIYTKDGKQQYRTICASKVAHYFDVKPCNAAYTDIILGQPFDLDSVALDSVEYQKLPQGIFLQDLVDSTKLTSIFG
jgi:hypothetical protein